MIVKKLKNTDRPVYRPAIPRHEAEGVHPEVLNLMRKCWAEEPSERPSFNEVTKSLRIINEGKLVLVNGEH